MSVTKELIQAFETSDVLPPAAPPRPGYDCDVCDQHFEGEPAGAGLFMWTRGDEVRFEEPPLCAECAERVTQGALTRFEIEEEEEG
jgi:hypothetical protein